jgi:IclR family acetate operon transcriptional repressor
MTRRHVTGVRSVGRALDVLEALAAPAAASGYGLSELSEATRLPAPTVHRLLATLVTRGWVTQRPSSRKYVLGSAPIRVAASAGRLDATARPWLAGLAELSGETAGLATLEDGWLVHTAEVPAPARLRVDVGLGERLRPAALAAGRVLLALLPPAEAGLILERTGGVRSAALVADLEATATRGWAADEPGPEAAGHGLRGIAVPVVRAGIPVAAVSLTGPAARFHRAAAERLLPALTVAAATIAAEVAWDVTAGPPRVGPAATT